ncbi:MAG: hypothetical protein FJ301_05990 [Planctomycetes bacterium]|nr:hypothetical protein [Planctomycetota bacterium]
MARKGSKSSGALARHHGLVLAGAGLVACVLLVVLLIAQIADGIADPAVVSRGWTVGLLLGGLFGVAIGAVGYALGGKVGSRVTDIGLAVGKIGRGSSEVKVRVGGDDEVGALGRSVQYLATDLQALLAAQEQSGGAANVAMDPLVRQMRDKTLPTTLPGVPGHEVDGQLAAGSRGGLDYFDLVAAPGEAPSHIAYVVSAEGQGPLAVLACKLARDEIHRALQQAATPRKALAHANRVCKNALPQGVCAKATLLQVGPDGCKLYQAGAHTPLLICQRNEVMELNAEGIALGLDDGPVFEKSLRPQEIAMSPGTRLVLGNDALLRTAGLLDMLRQSSPRNTRMFMDVVLGGIEQDAGADGLREDVLLLTVKKSVDGAGGA